MIGNQDYSEWKVLKNPHNDVEKIGTVLNKYGFNTEIYYDLKYIEMREKVAEIKYNVESFSTNFFYFAGHGFENNGQNYLVPCDAKLNKVDDVKDCINITDFVVNLGRKTKTTNIVILDCCRSYANNEEYSDIIKDQIKTIEINEGTYVMFATTSGFGARDDYGGRGNSIFAQALLECLEGKNVHIETLSKNVRKLVLEWSASTGPKQLTWDYSSLINDVILNPDVETLANEWIKERYAANMKLGEIENSVFEFSKYEKSYNELLINKVLEIIEYDEVNKE